MGILSKTTNGRYENGRKEPGVMVHSFNPNMQDGNIAPAWAIIRSCLKMELVSQLAMVQLKVLG